MCAFVSVYWACLSVRERERERERVYVCVPTDVHVYIMVRELLKSILRARISKRLVRPVEYLLSNS